MVTASDTLSLFSFFCPHPPKTAAFFSGSPRPPAFSRPGSRRGSTSTGSCSEIVWAQIPDPWTKTRPFVRSCAHETARWVGAAHGGDAQPPSFQDEGSRSRQEFGRMVSLGVDLQGVLFWCFCVFVLVACQRGTTRADTVCLKIAAWKLNQRSSPL